MNQRIRELAKEAGFEIDNGPIIPGLTTITMRVGGLYVGVPVERFAKLIVKECIIKAEEEKVRFFAMHEIDLGFCMENFQNLLKQDFGIEE